MEQGNNKNILIAQSGGPTAVINASLAGAISRGLEKNPQGKVLGARYGLEGLLKGDVLELDPLFKDENELISLAQTPAMALGSCRFKLPKDDEHIYGRILDRLKEFNVGYFFYIGGNDSMDTVAKLSRYVASVGSKVRVMGIPKTIDNDLVGTDHTCGYGSAARYIATSVAEVALDNRVYQKPSVTIIEIMGRNAGWLTAAACLGGQSGVPEILLLPEVPFDKEAFYKKVETVLKDQSAFVVAVSEGLRQTDGNYLAAKDGAGHDNFGHAQLSGAGRSIEALLKEKFDIKSRCVELSTLQRSASHFASDVDRDEAWQCGEWAVDYALAGESGKMVTMIRRPGDYVVDYMLVEAQEVANAEKTIPRHWISEDGFAMTQEFINYALPLIGKDGLPKYFDFESKKSVVSEVENNL